MNVSSVTERRGERTQKLQGGVTPPPHNSFNVTLRNFVCISACTRREKMTLGVCVHHGAIPLVVPHLSRQSGLGGWIHAHRRPFFDKTYSFTEAGSLKLALDYWVGAGGAGGG